MRLVSSVAGDAKTRGFGARHFGATHRQISVIFDVEIQHFGIIHFVNVIAAQYHHVRRFFLLQHIDILENRVGCALIPTFHVGVAAAESRRYIRP